MSNVSYEPNWTALAGDDIHECRFVSLSGARTVMEAGEIGSVGYVGVPVGISGRAVASGVPGATLNAYAYASGYSAGVHTTGQICQLELGETVSVGDFLNSGAEGVGMIADPGDDFAVARALEGGDSGAKILVVVL